MAGNILAVGASFLIPVDKQIQGHLPYRLQNDGSTTFLSKITANDKAPNDEFGEPFQSREIYGSRSIVVRS